MKCLAKRWGVRSPPIVLRKCRHVLLKVFTSSFREFQKNKEVFEDVVARSPLCPPGLVWATIQIRSCMSVEASGIQTCPSDVR
jgi:hypothetical protein